jgi:LPS export ABC transporter permease LptG/LPS export ABC transporter permease LptF
MIRLIDRYLLGEIVPYLLLSLFLLTGIIFLHQANRFSELIVIASRDGLPFGALGQIMAALIPEILLFTVPTSLLLGVLVGLGRLSGDGEIVALGASGVSRFYILRSVGALSLLVAALMTYLTFEILPRSTRKLNDLKSENRALLFQGLKTEIKPRVFEESIPNKVIYIEDIDKAHDRWRNIFLVDLGQDKSELRIFTASAGTLRQGSRWPELQLEGGSAHQISRAAQPDGDDSSKQAKGLLNYTLTRFDRLSLVLEVPEQREARAIIERDRQPVSEMSWPELVNFTPAESERRIWRAEIHERVALPAACLVLALLGVGFGISNVRTGRSFGLLLGIAITITYYLLWLAGRHMAISGKLPVWLGMWMANMILGLAGATIILIQRRSGSDVLWLLRRSGHFWRGFRQAIAKTRVRAEAARAPLKNGRSLLLVDRLVLSELTRFFCYILVGFCALFMIVTLFQLLDSITRNKIGWSVVASYLIFLTPMILNYAAPVAALVAVMVTFGLLEKQNQVMAFKASGQSIYRLTAPALIASLLLAGLIFLNQDYVLPFTNRRQDSLLHLIRSGQEPPKTFYQADHQWIFGSNARIYNYDHFDPINNVFAKLTVLDLEREPFGIKRRIFARRAKWDQAGREWVLEGGWERRFQDGRVTYHEQFQERREAFPEGPDYFKQDWRASSMMSLAELRRQMRNLARAGFDVLDLRIAFHGKLAFPLTCLVMVLIGVPFALLVGRRGALHGVTVGLAIGLIYWGALGLFEQMGRYELLPPLLAAWGPNLIFGASGLYLFLTSRT